MEWDLRILFVVKLIYAKINSIYIEILIFRIVKFKIFNNIIYSFHKRNYKDKKRGVEYGKKEEYFYGSN